MPTVNIPSNYKTANDVKQALATRLRELLTHNRWRLPISRACQT